MKYIYKALAFGLVCALSCQQAYASPTEQNPIAASYPNFEGSYKNKTYKFIFDSVSWQEASEKAQAIGGNLACVDTDEKLNYLQALRELNANVQPVWVGLTDSVNEGQWQWVCGNDLEPKMTYWLERGRELEQRDYGHLTQRIGFLSRTNEGENPNFIRGAASIKGYVVEIDKSNAAASSDVIDDKYQAQSPSLFAKLLEARNLLESWRGQQELLISANKILEDIITENDLFAPAYKEMANVLILDSMVNSGYHHRHQLVQGEEYLYKAIALEPKYADAYILLADAFIKRLRSRRIPRIYAGMN